MAVAGAAARVIPTEEMVKVRRFLMLAALLGVAGLAVGCGSDGGGGAAQGSGPIQVGAVLSLTGSSAVLGEHERDGVEAAVEEINAAGGVNGRQLKVTFVDDAGDPNGAVAAFNRLTSDDDVVAVFGATFGSSTLAISPLSKRTGMPLLAPNTTYEITHQGNEYLFRVAPPADAEVEAAVAHIKEAGYQRLGVLTSTDAYGAQAGDLLEEAGVSIVARETFAKEATNLTSQLTKLRAANPDALVVWDHAPATGIAIRNAADLGMTEIPILSGQASNNPGNIEAASGSDALQNWLVQGVVDPMNPLPRQEEGLEVLQQSVDYPIDIFASIGYDGMHILKEALEAAGDGADREALRDALEQVSYEGVGGSYQYSAEDHDGVGPESIVWLEVQDDKFVAADVQ